jgi:hypothetical protein
LVPPPIENDDSALTIALSYPSAIPGGAATIAGQFGSDVTGLSVHTEDGQTVSATIFDGFNVAAWEGMDFSDVDTLGASFTVHLADGRTRTVSYPNLPEGEY